MSLFVCEICHGIDNTALAPGYWQSKQQGMGTGRVLCTECETGRWHGRFPKRTYDERRDGPIDQARRLMSAPTLMP